MAVFDLGCGDNPYPGCLGYDARALPGVAVRGDVRRLPFRDGALDGLVSRHCIEHMTRADALSALREWRRALRPGGTLRLTCPDMVAMCISYLHLTDAGNQAEVVKLTHNFFGGQDYPENFHAWGWNVASLADALRAAGFSRVLLQRPDDPHELHLLAVA